MNLDPKAVDTSALQRTPIGAEEVTRESLNKLPFQPSSSKPPAGTKKHTQTSRVVLVTANEPHLSNPSALRQSTLKIDPETKITGLQIERFGTPAAPMNYGSSAVLHLLRCPRRPCRLGCFLPTYPKPMVGILGLVPCWRCWHCRVPGCYGRRHCSVYPRHR